MDRDRVAKTWLTYGLSDLLFGFATEDEAFEHNATFSAIMGLEKFMKAPLLYARHAEYEHLPEAEARLSVNGIAKFYSHKFRLMFDELETLAPAEFQRIRSGAYDGYDGDRLFEAAAGGYMETRYPVPKPVSDLFPLGNGFYHDPLHSSGFIKFIYRLCNSCYFHLSAQTDLTDMRVQFAQVHNHVAALPRFDTIFWEARCALRL